ncbi:MAG TPA: efflux RND transporter permease subunit [Bryobacteraceae bacterium]|nr:efflux RND transporter permease subunit [Bryobacteraceae bacterium]
MQKLAEICVKRPVFAVMLILAMVVVGAVAYGRLGVDRFPDVDLPIVSVRTTLLGASPEEMESTVTRRIEDAVATVEGIDDIRSTSTESLSIVTLTFGLNRNIDVAAQDVRDAIATVIALLPRDAKPPLIRKLDTDASPILTLVVSGTRTPRELYEIAERQVKDSIESVGGVGQTVINGGQKRAVNVWIDADRLAAYKIPILRVRDAVARQNSEIPGGRVDEGARELVLRTLGRFPDPARFNDLIVATIGNSPVRIRDIGYAEDGHKEQRTFATYDGAPAVAIELRRQSGANTIEVINNVKARLDRVRQLLPSGVRLDVVQDQSRYIEAAFHEVQLHLILGAILASLVVFLFMRDWRATVIAAVAIPASIIATFGAMYWLNFTLNNITMLALVLMVGVVIDDAIVVLENIFRFIEEKQMPPMLAAIHATRDIGLAVMATTLSLVVVFLPVSFMSSVSGRFLYSFGVTAAVAIFVSLIVSFSLTPMMSSRMLRLDHTATDKAKASRRGIYLRIEEAYLRLLAWSMRRRAVVMALALVVMATSVPLYKMVRQEYIPTNVDEGEFEMSVSAPEGTSLASMQDVLDRVYADLKTMPGVRHVVTIAGTGYLQQVNSSRVYVRLDDIEDRVFSLTRFVEKTFQGKPAEAFQGIYSQRDVMSAIRERLREFKDLRVRVGNLQTMSQGTAPYDIDFAIRGPDLIALNNYSERLRHAAMTEIPGLVDVDTTLRLNKPELHVAIDRERAADLGVDASDIASSLRIMVGGDDEVSRYHDKELAEEYDVEVRLKGADRGSSDTISKLYVPSTKTGMVRLDNVVQMSESTSAYRIEGLNRQRVVGIRANVAGGYALADRLPEMFKAADALNMPAAYSTTVIGRGREFERTLTEFLLAFALSVVFMYMILASQFESLIHPVTILLSLPLAIPFGFLSLWLFRDTLNLYSALGILVLFGVVKKNSILQVDHTNNLRREGLDRTTAILQANRDRLRPILMTTLTLVAGMLPLALGAGPGAEERRSIAIIVIGGQSLSLLLTLIVTPIAYSLFDDLGALVPRRRSPVLDTTPVAGD